MIGEAAELGADLIVSHHPLFFELKNVTDSDTTSARVLHLARAGMSAICMHTNLDIAPGGVNDALCETLGIADAGGLRYVDAGRPVHHVAVLGGAGGNEMLEALEAGADTYVTADVKHHQFIDARELGLNLIDAGHFSTENVVVPVLASLIAERFPDVDVRVSEAHEQPEKFF